jgi:hypothetical protein
MGNSKDKPQTDFNWEAQWQQLYLLKTDTLTYNFIKMI